MICFTPIFTPLWAHSTPTLHRFKPSTGAWRNASQVQVLLCPFFTWFARASECAGRATRRDSERLGVTRSDSERFGAYPWGSARGSSEIQPKPAVTLKSDNCGQNGQNGQSGQSGPSGQSGRPAETRRDAEVTCACAPLIYTWLLHLHLTFIYT